MPNNGYSANNEKSRSKSRSRSKSKSHQIAHKIKRRDKDAGILRTYWEARGITRDELYNNRRRYGLYGLFAGDKFKSAASGGTRKRKSQI